METRPAPMATARRLGFVEATQSHPKATAPAHPRVPSCADSRIAKYSSTQPELSGSEGMRSPLLNPSGSERQQRPQTLSLSATHACVHTHTHVYPLPQVTCVHVYTHACAHPINHMHVYTDTRMWVHMHTHKPHVCAHMDMHTHTCMSTPQLIHMFSHIHTPHTHINHTHTRVHVITLTYVHTLKPIRAHS